MRLTLTLLSIALLTGLTVSGASGGDTDPSLEELRKAAARLSDPDPKTRDEAERKLKSAGAAAEPALRAAAESADPEAARRARALLREVKQPVPEELVEPEPQELRAYRNANRESKARLIEQVGNQGGQRAAVVVQMWAEEEEPDLRATLQRMMLQMPGAHASAMIARGSTPAARQLLETAIAQGNAEAPSAYAALCLARGDVKQAIDQWSNRPGGGEDDKNDAGRAAAAAAPGVLARLHRAGGDMKRAGDYARESGDLALLEEVLLDAGEWAALAELYESRGPLGMPLQRPQQFGMLAASLHLAGDEARFAGAIERMRKVANADTIDEVAKVLLLTGAAEQGLRAFAEANRPADRFKMLAAREQWDEALALLASQDGARDEPASRLRITAAEQLDLLGESARAADLLDRVARDNTPAPNNVQLETELAEANRRVGRADKAWEIYRALFKVPQDRDRDRDRGRDHTPRIANQAFQVGIDVDGDGDGDASGGADLWVVLQMQFPADNLDQRFDRARSVVERTMSLADLTALVERANGPASPNRYPVYGSNLIRILGERLDEAGKRADAERLVAAAAERAPTPYHAAALYLWLGDRAAAAQEWVKAANFFGRAWNTDRSFPTPLHLHGWALRRAGYHARGAEATNLAHVMPLGDVGRRAIAVNALRLRRIDPALAAEAALIHHTVRLDIGAAHIAQHYSAEQAIRAGDWLAAAAWYERAMLKFIASGYDADPVFYLRMPHTVRRLRARGLIAKGELDAAEREIAVCRALLPNEGSLPIEVVPELENRGNKARADELYGESMRAYEAVIAKYPNAANHCNNAAWLAVNCGRDGEKALALAKRAVELRPKNAAYVDTLGEVQFRRGEFDEAIKLMKRCVELEPRQPRHREQLERFEAGKRGEVRAMPPG